MFSVLTMICLSPLNASDQQCFSYSAIELVDTIEVCEILKVPTMYQLVEMVQPIIGTDIEIVSVDATCVSWTTS